MGVFTDNRPRRAPRAGAARKRAAPSPWLSAGGKNGDETEETLVIGVGVGVGGMEWSDVAMIDVIILVALVSNSSPETDNT